MSNWKHNELQMFNDLATKFPELKKAEDEYSRYDCHNSSHIIELKHRGSRDYGSHYLERPKANCLVRTAMETDREALYASKMAGNTYIFNLSRMYLDKYDWNWFTKRLPATSHFSNNGLINKEVCALPHCIASDIITKRE